MSEKIKIAVEYQDRNLTHQEEASFGFLLERWQDRSSLRLFDLIEPWRRGVEEICHGKIFSVDDYFYNLNPRLIIEKVLSTADATLISEISPIVEALDTTFRACTFQVVTPVVRWEPGVERWWAYRVPVRLRGDTLEDFAEVYFRELSAKGFFESEP